MGFRESPKEQKPSPECNEKESDKTPRDPHEQEILHQQSHIPEFKSSFLGLYRHANPLDICIVCASTLASIIAGALHPTAPIVNAYLLQYLSRAGIEGEALSPFIDEFTLYYVYFCIISLLSWTVATAGFIHTGARITRRIKKQYLSAVLRQNMGVFDIMEPGEILSHLTSDTNMIQEALSSKLAITIAAFGNLAGTIIVCFSLDWILTFILSWSFILGTAVLILGGKATVRYGGRSLDASSAGTAVVEEALGAIKSTTALGMQKQVQRTYVDYLNQAAKHGFILKTLNSSMISICVASGYINVALGFWQGSRRLVDGITPLPNVVAITIILKSAAFCVLNVGSNLEAFNMAVAAASRVYRMTRRVSPIDSLSNDGVVPNHLEGTIELRDVKLVYPSRPTLHVLEDLSVTFPAEKTTAIVGPSGSGKSSIASLILRFYNPVAGALLLDGNNLASFQLRWLRQQIHVVSQEPFLFNKTIYENISLGFTGPEWRTVSPEEKYQLVLKAAKAAQADDFINQLPEGYDTMIGTRASRLSGGQAQRIAIARAIVSQPKILILDEATSALDSETEAKVLKSMDENYPKCTKIVIAHRLSTIIDADKIVVVRSGHVVEEGTHKDLMDKQSLYFDLVKAQNLSREVGVDLESDEKHGADLDIAEEVIANASDDAKSFVDNDSSFSAIDELDEGKHTSSLWSLIKFGWRLNRPEIFWVIIALVCCAIAGVEEPASAILFGSAIVSVSQPLSEGDKIRSETGFYSWMFFLLAMVMLLVFGAEGIIFGWCSQKMTDRARKMALEKILAMDVAFFDKKKNSAGALASFLSTSSNDLAGVSGSALGIILICSSTAISGIVVGMAFGWKLALVCLSLFPLLVASGYFGVWLVGEFERHIETFNNEAAELASETFSGIRTIATMTMEEMAIDQFENILKANTTRFLRMNLQTSFLYALAQAIYYAGMALSFWYGSKLVMRGEYTLDQFVVVQSSMLMSAYSAGLVFSWTPGISKAKSASSRLESLLSQKPNIDPSNDAAGTELDMLNGQIDFDSVTYFYPTRPNRPALKDLSFSISPGSSVAFVGPTGSGKSTVVSMIERFYDPTQGSVRIDGHQLSSLQVAKYRRRIGLVSQDPILYNGTIKMNIMAGLEDEALKPSDADMEEACIQANIYDFIKSLPNGFETKVGSRGTQLSVGQKQRVALARALIRRPSILILDEATSALDSQSEALIHDALESAKKGRTTITIAHRLSTILNSDKIFLLNHGSIAEAGTHMELMAKRKMYYGLFTATRSGVDV